MRHVLSYYHKELVDKLQILHQNNLRVEDKGEDTYYFDGNLLMIKKILSNQLSLQQMS